MKLLGIEWDAEKNEINKREHNISFESAVLFVVYTENKEGKRIISARVAEKHER